MDLDYGIHELIQIGFLIAIAVGIIFAICMLAKGWILDRRRKKLEACPICGKAGACPCGY